MKTISSRDNPDYRLLQRVMAGKRAPGERSDSAQRIALEGVHLCESWLSFVGQPDLAFFDQERLSHPEVAPILRQVDPSRVRLCTPAMLQAASQVVKGQGLVFLGTAPRPDPPQRLTENCLWLDRVQDPGNMGTLLRTAAAAGIQQVYASAGSVAAWSPKVLRSAQGAHFQLNLYENQDLFSLRTRLDIPMVVTALENAHSLYEATLPKNVAWVFGNEGQGVAAELISKADLRVMIPQAPAVESLNVAIAAGVCLFEQRRRYIGGA